MSKTQTVLTHHVQMDKYLVPKSICEQGNEAIEEYISDKEPDSESCRDWEIVDTNA